MVPIQRGTKSLNRRRHTVADGLRIELLELLRKAEAEPELDFPREGVRVLPQQLMEIEVEQHTPAARVPAPPGASGAGSGRDTGTATGGVRSTRG